MGKLKFALLIFFGLFIFIILDTQKVQAADSDVVINEVMANAPTPENKLEWVELYNIGKDPIDLKDWTFDGKSISNIPFLIEPQNYLILARDTDAFKAQWADVTAPIVTISMVLTNNTDKVILENTDGTYVEEFEWINDTGDNIPWEKIDPLKTTNDNWYPSLISGGTPGKINSVATITKPQSPTLVSPTDGQKIPFTEKLDFNWQEASANVSFEFILSQKSDLSDPIIDEPNLADLKYSAEDLTAGIFYWQVIASNALYESKSLIQSFEILPVVYSNAIIINELYPDPSSGEEWIELFNNSAEVVNLKDWILEDLKGSIHQYKINEDLIIPGFGYLAILRSQSGITLNNDSDGGRLTRPDGKILYETPIYANGEKGSSYARASTGGWVFTTKVTPAAVNIIVAPAIEEAGGDDEEKEEDIPKNSTPIEIKTGEYQNFEDYLVQVQGTVIETSGNTFYLDDSSGKAKIYIQDKTGIDKPKMYKGDIYSVIGIVNLFRNGWRILPRMQSDIKLIQAIKKETQETKKAVAVKSSASSSTAASKQSSSTTSNARSPTTTKVAANKKVASAQDVTANQEVQVAGAKSPFWLQTVKTLTGLMVIFLILLFIKIFQFKKERPWTGKFGDDFT